MKAWHIYDQWNNRAAVVFAETRGKAHSFAINYMDEFEDCDWCDLLVRRYPEMDDQYRPVLFDGEPRQMYWTDQRDRLALVKNGWTCDPDYYDENMCDDCLSTEYCELYKEHQKDKETE